MELEDHPLRHEIIKCLPTGPPRFEVSKIPANSEMADDSDDSVTNLDMSAMRQQITVNSLNAHFENVKGEIDLISEDGGIKEIFDQGKALERAGPKSKGCLLTRS